MSRHPLGRGVTIDAVDAGGITSLMFALQAGNKDAALALVDAGADLAAGEKSMGLVEHYATCLATGTALTGDGVLEALGNNPGTKRTLHLGDLQGDVRPCRRSCRCPGCSRTRKAA